ncbi:ParA family protein [Rhodococcus koreensis]|uniref:Plasmid segregation oscillating ATPase ParF n=1 Tax=Rhodococcus koreensis TaxID=99653 RepID=A0A1H4I5E2_9NOCA|nr:ParA family protein [Rhodococcus koreensis]SEB29163.1 plasmid segregation oscillating ATPase ParF [Rhodococcus koreensis]
MLVITVLNLKGGSSKTTSAAFIAHAMHESGLKVLAVDADGENESLLQWGSLGEWPFPVIGMAVPNLHRQLPGIANGKYDAVVIDTPPMKEQRSIVLSAARLATHVVCPMAPTPIEYNRLPAVRQLLVDVADLRDGDAPAFAVLFTRTVSNAASTEVYREMVAEDGDYVLKPTIGRLERYSQAFGMPIENALNSAYGDAVIELLDLDVQKEIA